MKKANKISSLRSIASRVTHNITKDIKAIFAEKSDDTFSLLLSKCTKQNQIIDLCAKYAKTFDFCANALVEKMLCKSIEHAQARIKRHKKNDIETAINSRLSNLK
jgi:hypothetical protein